MKKIAIILVAVIILSTVLCACSGGKKLSSVYEDITKQVELKDMLVLTTTDQLDKYYGIAAEDVEDFAGCINSTGVDQEEIIMIKATDDAAADRVKEALQLRYDTKLAQNKNYNAEQAEIIESCSVDQDGLYVSMIISTNADQIKEIYQKAIK
ncbi:MAG: DUF4358 domain-containing protein [Ruminococcus sp.]|nr:DUF4358 domain-containing protein [Ruminococcus sp.]